MELLEEIKLMKRIGQHEHVVSMIACITKSHPVCLIVEYCSHGDLSSYLKKGRGHVRRLCSDIVIYAVCVCM